MTLGAIARRYAGALFDIVAPQGRADRALEELVAFRDLVDSHADLKRVFDTPIVAVQKKRAIVESILATAPEMSNEVRRLLLLLADRDRLARLGDITAAFSDRVMQGRNEVAADVVTAVPLGDDRRVALAAALGRAAGQQVTVRDRVDPSIIGGVIARVGSVIFDGSVTRQIELMKERLMAAPSA